MSEFTPLPQSTEASRIHDSNLARLGGAILEAAARANLKEVVDAHITQTGQINPNSIPAEGAEGFTLSGGEVPMRSDSVYRQVHTEAVEDLAESGVVRNGATAKKGNAKRWGDRVFWHSGEDGKRVMLGGRLVIEADKSAAREGWVTADQVTGVYAHDSDGNVKNIIAKK